MPNTFGEVYKWSFFLKIYMHATKVNQLQDAIKVQNWLLAMNDASEYEWNIAKNDEKFRAKMRENCRILVDYAINKASDVAVKSIHEILNLVDNSIYKSPQIRHLSFAAQPILQDIETLLAPALHPQNAIRAAVAAA